MVLGLSNRQAHRTAAGLSACGLGALGAAFSLFAAAPAAADSAIPPAVNTGREWRIVKEAWEPADEAGYAAFVQAIGRSTCVSLPGCLASEANPYRATDTDWTFYGDCADMVFTLRAYYAWKNGLPFSYQNGMRTADGSRDDLRYSANGNVVAGRRDAVGSRPVSGPDYIGLIKGEVSTAMFRTDPAAGGKLHDDFYAIAINRESVKAGVVAYDIYGHVGIVYEVLDNGRVLVIASHPDESVTRTDYGPNFMRSKPALGAGLKGWRPVYLDGARRDADGSFVGGKVRGRANEAIADFSLEQFFGNAPHPSGEWHAGEFRHDSRTLGYYDYVRRKLAAPGFAYSPLDELRHGMQTICGAIKDRKVAVDRAVGAGFPGKPHPDRLPPNIYGTYGEWEGYSTPSRDARLKVSFIEMRRNMQELVEKVAAGDPSVTYAGADLGRDLWDAFEVEKEACTIIYRRSDDSRMKLNFGHVMDRLWELSFDPYHCAERRWGAAGAELESCTDDETKTRWYNAQKFMRYQAERTYDVRMDFTLDQLKPPMTARPEDGGLGVDAPADGDLRAYLAGLTSFEVAGDETTPLALRASAEPDDPRPTFPAWHKDETYKIRNFGAAKN